MELSELGFDSWFEEQAGKDRNPEYVPARVSAVDRDSYLVISGKGEVLAKIEGKLRYNAGSSMELPAVGDWVYVRYLDNDTLAIINEVLPRKTFLRRKTSGRKTEYQMIAANLDTAFIMQSLDLNFNLRRLERYLVAVNEGGIKPVILLSKSDLVPAREIEEKVSSVFRLYGKPEVLVFSNKTEEGPGKISGIMETGKTYCLIGSSGVGKTTLINRLLGEEVYATTEVREWESRGRHTTNRRQLIALKSGGLLIDTPGMRELGNISVEAGLAATFPDIAALAGECRFNDCTHASEPGCAIIAALEKGEIDAGYFKSYKKLRKETEFNEMTYAEKRQKDKEFGKFVKKVMKSPRKKY